MNPILMILMLPLYITIYYNSNRNWNMLTTSKKKMKGGSLDSDYDWVFYILFFAILYTLGLVALYSVNSEMIGFVIMFAAQILLAYTFISGFIHKTDGFKEFRYDESVPQSNVTFSPAFTSVVGNMKLLFNINVAIVFELIMVFVSLLLILITYGNIDSQYSTFGVKTINVLSDVDKPVQPAIIHEKDNFKVILIVLTTIVAGLVGINKFYAQIVGIFTNGFSSLQSTGSKRSSTILFAFLCVYFIGSIIFLFFGLFPLEIINTNGQILDAKKQLPITIVSVINMSILCIFGWFCYDYYKSKKMTSNSKSLENGINYVYMLFIIAIYYLSCWQIYISNSLMDHFKPSNLLDPRVKSTSGTFTELRLALGEVQGCDPSKPETCPKPGYLPFQWLYSL